ncbi:ester cyclase [Streptomyces nigra]|uniref:ester cyclase n=1 Tax=Streptomyces nigra TaxID=1827580 RepID=UPI003648A94C
MTLTDQERTAKQRQVVDTHIRQENAHEWESVYDTMLRDERAYYDVVPLSTRYHAFQEVQGFYELFESALPDFHVTITGSCDSPGLSLREVTITGTHQGEYCGVEPKNHRVSFEMAAVYVFLDDEPYKIAAQRIYFDNETVLRQMRGEEGALTGIGLAKETHPGS